MGLTHPACETGVRQVLIRKRVELQRSSPCVFVCSLTYKAVRVLGAQAAAGTFTMTAVADVRPEASTVTLLCTHRLSHCPGSEKKRILKVWHTHAQPGSTDALDLPATWQVHANFVGAETNQKLQRFKGWTSGLVAIRSLDRL